MDKRILEQYNDLQKEIADIKRRRDKLRKREELVLTDCVKGSSNVYPFTQRTFKIEGVGVSKKRSSRYDLLLKNAESELEALKLKMEEYIETLPDSDIRNILRLKYFDNLNWVQIAQRLGGTADCFRMRYKRYFEGNK